MCLNPKKIDTEGKDIKVYKVITVKTDPYGSAVYRSPYFKDMKSSVWNIGETNHSESSYGDSDGPDMMRYSGVSGEFFEIRGNAFHSFENLSDAIVELAHLRYCTENVGIPYNTGEYKIGRFTIPGDSKYVYVGDEMVCTPPSMDEPYASFAKSYASESLRFDGLVENEI